MTEVTAKARPLWNLKGRVETGGDGQVKSPSLQTDPLVELGAWSLHDGPGLDSSGGRTHPQ